MFGSHLETIALIRPDTDPSYKIAKNLSKTVHLSIKPGDESFLKLLHRLKAKQGKVIFIDREDYERAKRLLGDVSWVELNPVEKEEE